LEQGFRNTIFLKRKKTPRKIGSESKERKVKKRKKKFGKCFMWTTSLEGEKEKSFCLDKELKKGI